MHSLALEFELNCLLSTKVIAFFFLLSFSTEITFLKLARLFCFTIRSLPIRYDLIIRLVHSYLLQLRVTFSFQNSLKIDRAFGKLRVSFYVSPSLS